MCLCVEVQAVLDQISKIPLRLILTFFKHPLPFLELLF